MSGCDGRRGSATAPGRVSRIRIATIDARGCGQCGDGEDRHPSVEPVGEEPDQDRPDREAEITPEAVDPGHRTAPSRLGDIGDDRDQRRVDHRRPEAEEDRRREPRDEPGRRGDRGDGERLGQHPGDDQPLPADPVRERARRDLGDAPRRGVGRREQADLRDREARGGLDDRQEPPGHARR